MCCMISWEVPQNILEFFDSQKTLFRMVNRQNVQEKIPRKYPQGGKILLKIILASFMLITCSDKFQNILIVRKTWMCNIP